MPNGGSHCETDEEKVRSILSSMAIEVAYCDDRRVFEVTPERDLAVLQEAKRIKANKTRYSKIKELLAQQEKSAQAHLRKTKARIEEL